MKYLLLFLLISLPVISYSQDEIEMKSGDTTYVIKKYYLCFLKRGANKDMDSVQISKIQEGHLAHLTELSNQGKICIAGPFGDNGDLRGIIIFNVASLDEAEKLESEDPAVKAGRLTMEIKPWWGMKGSMLK
jgi:uncharacterized protein YciI